jgi:cyclic beta-1,2-glucan synthetase
VLALRADLVGEDERALLRAAARVSLTGGRGTLAEQVLRRYRADTGYAPARTEGPPRDPPPALKAPPGLEFFNGLGGFADGGREYLIALGPGQCTPAPWINVLANPSFGCMVSESGGGSAWSLNSRENPLTPWSNDPVSDPPGEAFYLRDEDGGALWSPTALPIRVAGAGYLIRHGQGYSRFEHASHGIHSELLVCVDPADPVKVSRLTLRNDSGRPRRLAVAAYAEWALGLPRESAAPHVVTWQDPDTGALCAANPWSAEFGQRVAFADLSGAPLTSWTCSRAEFLGRNGALDAPAGLLIKKPWGRRAGPALDPCAALLAAVELAPGASAELVFLLGQGANQEEAAALVRQHRPAAAEALERVRQAWEPMLDTLQISTPDRGLDLLVNRWLPYQSLSCRVWARAAFYQAGGAYGFRDQLQDVMALALLRPELARAHILRAAERQFPEGDAQHWWHPPLGRGVRTHCSDDRVWLPYAVAHYLAVTGDAAVLDEALPFLVGQPLAPGQEDAYRTYALTAALNCGFR